MSKFISEQEKLYFDELDYVKKKGAMLRNVVVLSAMMEAQMYSLAKSFLDKRDVFYKMSESQEYNISKNILENNKILSEIEIKDINEFRKYRREIFHNLFKGELTRDGFNVLIKKAYNVGIKIVENLRIKQSSDL